MLAFSPEQFATLRHDRLRRFATRLAQRARRLHPAACADTADEALADLMESVIEAARARGLRKASELERFADLSMTLGAGFETERDWAAAIFADEALRPAARLRRAEASAVFAIREG